MGPEGMILVNPPISTFQQSLTHSALAQLFFPFSQQNNKMDLCGSTPMHYGLSSVEKW